jgi:hypothetical protein
MIKSFPFPHLVLRDLYQKIPGGSGKTAQVFTKIAD